MTMPSSVAASSAPAFATLAVTDVRRDTANSVVVTLDAGGDDRFRFVHGQHLTFSRNFDDVGVRRSYSICSSAQSGELAVGIKRVEGGVFSTWANTELAEGDQLRVMTPTGSFTHTLDPAAARSYTLVAAGSGITPIASIAATVLEAEPASVVTLLQIDQTLASIMLLPEIEALRNWYLGRLRIWHVLTREPTDSPLLSGRPDGPRFEAFIDSGMLDEAPDHVFVCGPEEVVETVRAVYEARGTDPDLVHDELFTSAQVGRIESAGPAVVSDGAIPVATGSAVLHGRRLAFAMYEGDTVLDAAQRVRHDVPFSCRAGVCSSCRAHLTEGEVTMGVTHGLVPGDADGGFILTCQAHPTSSMITVDFDR
ncbi:2Fe-2S iron-sulfur cluster binding domain-containing protein [Acidimicrobiaceae bacterium AH-315-P05]|nr:2Fe-2S iron-sulfur cluster binding domain-containing protein [Acidimicrobiaceae bacterium AH-315-P05]